MNKTGNEGLQKYQEQKKNRDQYNRCAKQAKGTREALC